MDINDFMYANTLTKKLIDDKSRQKIVKKAKATVEKEVEIYEKMEPPKPEDIVKYTFSEVTPNLKEQLEEIK